GARKGLADTALRTADSGYLTRRLVDVAQDVIVRELDCGSTNYMTLPQFTDEAMTEINDSPLGRIMAEPLVDKNGEVIADVGEELTAVGVRKYAESFGGKPPKAAPMVTMRSVLHCEATHGICQACYGRSFGDGRVAEL